jgi:hypothetical protein
MRIGWQQGGFGRRHDETDPDARSCALRGDPAKDGGKSAPPAIRLFPGNGARALVAS